MDQQLLERTEISAQEYVDHLLNVGAEIPCDNTNETFIKQGDSLPPYFDRHLFKKGQELYFKHIYAMNVMHALGIVVLYAVKSAFNVATSAAGPAAGVYDIYRRQMRTNTNLHSFYYSDFGPESSEWKKIAKTKRIHNLVSKGSIKQGFNALTQKEMALGQFFIIGLSLVRGEMTGMHGVTEAEWKGFHHYWRVIGYLVGIEERFNICSVPVDMTRKISELLIKQVFKPAMDRKDPEFLKVAKLSCLCWQPILPDLEVSCAINHAYNLLQPNEVTRFPEPTYLGMNWFLRVYYKFFVFSVMYLLRWDAYRVAKNVVHKFILYLITTYPLIPKIHCTISNYINLRQFQ